MVSPMIAPSTAAAITAARLSRPSYAITPPTNTAISPGNTINYYESVLKKMGGKQEDFVRLYMAPGMQHCGGGPGPNQINYMAIMERWRESNQTPASIEAYHVANNRVDMTRPLCAYPQIATYKGVGSINDAANFVCK